MKDLENFCFCGLALGKNYRICAQNLAKDLQQYHPGIYYLVMTDKATDFQDLDNVIAINHRQDSIMFPYHDRRFAFQEALARFDLAIQIDTDVRILKPLTFPEEVTNLDGLWGNTKNLKEHLDKFHPEQIELYANLAERLGVDLAQASYVGEFIFAVSRNHGQEKEWIESWAKIARYLELHKVHGADGPAIGLAAAKAKLNIYPSEWPWQLEREFLDHLKFSSGKGRREKTKLEKLKFRLNYHYRLNKARLLALQDFSFYY